MYHSGNGKEVIARWKEGGYDLIFMDVHMPEMDGLEATEMIRNLEEKFKNDHDTNNRERVPIIAMTACAMEGDKERCLATGMDDYISKPINLEKLKECINRNISNKQTVDIPKSVNTEKINEEPPYDLSNLNILLDNNKAAIKNIIKKFIESAEQNIQSLESAIQSRDIREIQHISHTP